jgi:hypothetical protein
MNQMNLKYFSRLLVLAFFLIKSVAGFAANYTCLNSGDWSSSSSWSPAGIPASGDDITIGNGQTITYSGNLQWTGGTINISGTGKLIVTGSFTCSGGTYTTGQSSDFQVGGSFTIDYGKSFSIGGNLKVSGDLNCRGSLSVGGNCTSQNGGILSDSMIPVTVGGNLSVKTSVATNGTYNVTGSVTVSGGYFTNGDSRTFTIGQSLNVSGDIDNKGTLQIGTDCISTNGAILNESARQLTIGGSMSSKTSITNNGIVNVPGNVTVSNGNFTNGDSRTFTIGQSLTVYGNIDNKGTLDILNNCTSSAGQISNSSNQTFSVGGNMTAHSGLLNYGNLNILKGCIVDGGGALNDYAHNLTIGGTFSVYGGLTNNGIAVVNGNFDLLSGDLSVDYQRLMVVNGNFTKSGNVNLSGTLIVTGNFNSSGGSTNINQYNGNFYAFQTISENGAQAGCTSGCFPYNPPTCTICQIKGLAAWQSSGSPGSSYVTLTSSWWTDHLADKGEETGPVTICNTSAASYSVLAVDDGNLAANTFEWAAYGGTISGASNTATINGHTASVKTITGVGSNNKSSVTVTWDGTVFSGAYVAVRQIPQNGCSDEKWSIIYVDFIPSASIASVTGTATLCIGSTATYSANTVVLGGGTGAWSSSNTGIATVDASGVVTGVASGLCDIVYTISGGCGGTVSARQSVTIQRINAIVTDADASSTDCPDFLGPWDANANSYNAGVTQVIFTVSRESSSTNWGFNYGITGATVYATSPNPQTGTISGLSANSTNLIFYITNIPGSQQEVTLTISNVADANCPETKTDDNSAMHTIKAMPKIGSFN